MASELACYDLTISVDKSTTNYLDVVERLRGVFKEWAFQREVGDSGFDHWQVRGKLFKKRNIGVCIKQFGEKLWHARWSPTCNSVHNAKSFNYMMKDDTRKDGPWTSKDPELEDPPVLTRQLRTMYEHWELTGKYPWQVDLEEIIKRLEDRKITCVVCTEGDNGKSTFAEHLEYIRVAYEIPPMTCMEDIMQCCMGIAAQKCYLVDMPRAMKKDKLAGFYAGLEALKNGVMYDKRYAFKKRRIDRPQIVVFTNCMPDRSLLTENRWDIYHIIQNRLVPEREIIPNAV